jgi:hypothetical protein
LVKDTSSKFIIFKAKYKLESKVPKCVVNMNFLKIDLETFLIINYIEILPNFEKELCTFYTRKGHLKKKKQFSTSKFGMFLKCTKILETSSFCIKF